MSATSAPIRGCGNVRFGKTAGRAGLANLGNTCFMNTGLQCLMHIEPLVAYFLGDRYKVDVNIKNPRGTKGELVKAFDDLLRQCWLGNDTYVTPRALHKKLSVIAPSLCSSYEQQDVQELLAFLLDGLHEDLNRVTKRPDPLTEAQQKEDERLCEGQSEEFAAALAWRRYLERSKSYLVDLLQGQLRSTLTCSQCGHESRCFDPFLYISVPVDRNMSTVSEAMERYLEAESLTGDEQWRCDKCKKRVDATKKIDLWKLPPVLVIHLKRFEFDVKTMRFQKITASITGPTTLDFSQYCSSQQREGAKYEVVAVANHSGPYGFGHYTATCRVGKDWYEFNDERVSALTSDVLTGNAYVVFLVRCRQEALLGENSLGLASQNLFPRQQSVSVPESWPHIVSSRNSWFARSMRSKPSQNGSTSGSASATGTQTSQTEGAGGHSQGVRVQKANSSDDRASCCLPAMWKSSNPRRTPITDAR
mmetsp:Transcript_75937/g.180552  ORF Transcript_75937/g.180552 Transcript_75937/m.180552 type:complete len:476 (-) Transcript_75937:62-1489(-)